MLGIGRLLAAVLPPSKRAAMKIGAEAPMSLKVSVDSPRTVFSEAGCNATGRWICVAPLENRPAGCAQVEQTGPLSFLSGNSLFSKGPLATRAQICAPTRFSRMIPAADS